MPPVPSAWPILDCCDAHSTAEVGQGVISHCRKKLALVYFRRNSSITVSHFLRPAGAAAPSVRLDLDADRRNLAETVAKLQPRLLILDPFVRLHRIDENASGEVAPLLAYLRELQRRHDVAVLADTGRVVKTDDGYRLADG